MNPIVQELWKAALRSDDYKQGIGQLRSSNDQFCCLGVLCDLYHNQTGEGRWVPNPDDGDYLFVDDSGSSSGFITEAVRKWAGLSDISPQVGYAYLHQLNDTGKPFVEIAKLLDEL